MIKVRDGYGKLIGSNYNGNIAHVLLSNGGNLEYAVGSTASTLVLRNASGQIESSVASTVAPFVISSTKVNTNLNADLLDGFLATDLFQSLTSAADKNLYIKIGDTEKEVSLLYASYLGGVTKEGLFTELTNVNDSTNPNSIKVTIGDTTKYLKVAYSDLAGKVVCSASANDVDRPIVVTNTSNGVYYSTKVTLNYSTGNVTAPTFTGALIGNADTATTASKLSTVSKTAWGLTYWTSDGVPTSISGDMIGVGNITFNKEKAFNIVSGGTFIPTSNTDDYWWGVHRYDTNVAIAVMPASGIFQARFETHLAFGSGNVGIGNTSPQQKLDVSGKIKADALYLTRSGGSVAFSIAEEAGTNGYNIIASGGSSFIRFYTNNTTTAEERMRLDSNGNLGIGTPTPGHKLHVVGNTWAAGFIKQDSSDNYVLLGGGGHKLLSELGVAGSYVTLDTNLTISGIKTFSTLLNFTVALGTAPFTVTSTTKVDNLNADLLDGLHGNWYLNNVIAFSRFNYTGTEQHDANVAIDGMLYNYGSPTYWRNTPDMSYGQILTLKSFGNNNLMGQLAWDIRHEESDTTRYLWWRAIQNESVISNAKWHQIAFTDSNVASATKLQTGRYIWGQLFDGTGNVDGILKMNVNVTAASVASSALQINNTGTYAGPRLINAYSPNLPVSSSDANGVHLMFGVTEASYNAAYIKFWYAGAGSTNNAIRFGFHTSDNLMSILANGNVGIGMTNPSYKLDVVGAIQSSDTVYGRAITAVGNTVGPYLPNINWFDLTGNTGFHVSYRLNESAKPLRFYYRTGDTFNLLVDITSTGNVIINSGSRPGLSIKSSFATSDNINIQSIFFLDKNGVDVGHIDVGGPANTNSVNGICGISMFNYRAYNNNSSGITAMGISNNNIPFVSCGGNGTPYYELLHTGNFTSRTAESKYWTATFNLNTWSRILSISDYTSVLVTIGLGGNNEATVHTYLISTGWNCARIVLIGNNGFSSYANIQVRITRTSSTLYYLEVYHTYNYNGNPDDAVCRFTKLSEWGTITPITTITAGGGTVCSSITSSATVAMNFYGERSVTADSAATLSGGSVATWGSLTAANGYTNVCTWDTGATTGAFSLAGKGGQMSLQLDGFFYQNEGKYLVLDTNNYASYIDGRYIYTGGMVNGAYAVIPTYNGETGWHRIAAIDGGTGYGSWILYLCGNWSWASNTSAILHINTMHTIAKITQVSGIVGFVTDVRLVPISNNNYYVDVYINYSGANTPGTVYCYFLGNGAIATRTTVEKITASVSTAASITLVTGTKTNDNSYAAHFYENSDVMLKTNIKSITDSDNMPILKSFNWKSDGSHGYGLIAQELEAMGYPELVSGELDGTKTVNYSAALSLIVGKLQVKIRELEKEIEILKNKN